MVIIMISVCILFMRVLKHSNLMLHDRLELTDKKLSDTEFIFSGRAEIDYLNEKYRLNLPESEEYETLSGMITHHHESIPPINEGIQIGHFFFKITKVGETRIELVHMKIIK